MLLPAAPYKTSRKKRETDEFSKSTFMTPPGSHPTSGFGARHGPPKFFRQKNAASYKTMRQVGGPRGIRTLDLSDANRTLSQLSYRPIINNIVSLPLLGTFVKQFRCRRSGSRAQEPLFRPLVGQHSKPAKSVFKFAKCVKQRVIKSKNRLDFYESKRFFLELVTGVEPATH